MGTRWESTGNEMGMGFFMYIEDKFCSFYRNCGKNGNKMILMWEK